MSTKRSEANSISKFGINERECLLISLYVESTEMVKYKELVHKSLIAEVVKVLEIEAVVIEHTNVYLMSLPARRLIYVFQFSLLLSTFFFSPVNRLLKLVSVAWVKMQLSFARYFIYSTAGYSTKYMKKFDTRGG
jgi:hypothetical protein